MNASREMFWNIPFGILVYAIGAVIIGMFVYAMARHVRLWRLGQPDPRFRDLARRLRSFARFAVADGLMHRRLLRQPYSGVMHLLLFAGTLVLLAGTIVEPLDHYFFHFLAGKPYLWMSLFLDLAGLAIIAGLFMAFLRRYVQRPARLDNITDDAVVLSLIFAIVVTGFFLEGLRIAQTELRTNPEWAVWSPVGLFLARGIAGLGDGAALALYRVAWWTHVFLFFGGVTYAVFAFTKFSHIVLGPVNAFFMSLGPRGVPAPIDILNAQSFGASKVLDLTWKDLLDLDACVRCGRCQDNCPAYLTGKPLSPKTLTQGLKASLLEAALVRRTEAGPGDDHPLIGPDGSGVVTEEELWACTTCGACEEACPLFVEHNNKTLAMRRNLVLEQARLPQTAQASLVNTQQRGHPWKGTTFSRTDWLSGLDVARASGDGDPSLLFWVGCSGALVERNMKVTAAFARLLSRAGVKFSVLGEEESCCGHFARRLGDEYLFQVQAEKNIVTLKSRNVTKIVTACPHCYHTLKNEYPQFGGVFEVLHHTEVIVDLLRAGRLDLDAEMIGTVTYQDPCYLGRYNAVYDAPRAILRALPNIELVEMARARAGGLCCGGGGGRMWIEEPPGQRVNQLRTKEAIGTGADAIAVACPLCLQMFDDAIKALGKEDGLRALDLAELVEASLMPVKAAPRVTMVAAAEEQPAVKELAVVGRGVRPPPD